MFVANSNLILDDIVHCLGLRKRAEFLGVSTEFPMLAQMTSLVTAEKWFTYGYDNVGSSSIHFKMLTKNNNASVIQVSG